jgi:hypothetical protein
MSVRESLQKNLGMVFSDVIGNQNGDSGAYCSLTSD